MGVLLGVQVGSLGWEQGEVGVSDEGSGKRCQGKVGGLTT